MKILIVSLDNLGDCVIAIGFAKALEKVLPNCEISLWLKEYAKDLACFTHYHNNFYSDPFWDTSPGRKKGSLKKFLETAKLIKKQNFDRTVILNTDWRKALLCKLVGTGKLYGINQKKSRFFLTSYVNCKSNIHISDCYKSIGNLFSGSFPEIHPALEITKEDKKFVSDLKNKLKGVHLGFHPFSGSPCKNWDIKKWILLAGKVLNYRKDVLIWIIAENYEAKKIADMSENVSRNKRILFSCDYTKNLRQTISLISGLDFFVGNDSGPLHIASALGIKSVGIFLESKKSFIPCGSEKPEILKAVDINSIETDEVFEKLEKFISSKV